MKKKICAILIGVLVAVLGTSTYFIIDHYKEADKQAELYDELASVVDAAAQTDAATEPTEQIPYSEEKMLLPELAELYEVTNLPTLLFLKDGELKLIYGPNRFCRYLGIEPTGNYQRLGLRNGTVALKDLRKGCLCPVSFSDFQMDAFTGHFGGEIRLAYLYTDEGVKILTGGSINGSLPEKQGNLLFSTERYDTLTYTGPYAVKIEGVEVAG